MTQELPPIKIALILDGKVIDVLHTDDRLASVFLSQPVIVDVTKFYKENNEENMVGWTYDGTNFIAPVA